MFEFTRISETWITKALAPRKSAAGWKLSGNCLVGVVNAATTLRFGFRGDGTGGGVLLSPKT
jgi:hypothetical protein